MKPLPIRLRLTLWYSVMFAVAAFLLSATSWWMLRKTIDATIHQDLQERIDDVRMELQRSAPDASNTDLKATLDAVYGYRDDGKWLQVMGQNGKWIYRSRRMAQQNVVLAMPAGLPNSGLQSELNAGGRSVRVMSSRVYANGRAYSVQTGVSMTKPRLLLHEFGLGLLCMTPAVLLFASASGHFLSRKALHPVAVIAHEARRITDRNLDRRLPVPPSDDELSHLSNTLNHMLARIDSSFRSVQEFTANASHEMRTPLTRIRMEAEIALLRPRQLNHYAQSLAKIHDDSVEMSGLIDNLLTLARAEAGSEVLRLEPVDLRELVSNIAEEWSSVAQRLSIKLSASSNVDNATFNGLMVLADRVALIRLLRIWLDNACKFTPPGGTILILTEIKDELAYLTVEDSGIGIAQEEHDRIFQRFYRVDNETSRSTNGAGLGLSLAAWIAEQHKTRISIESAPDKGTRLQIALRRTDGESVFPSRRGVGVGARHPHKVKQ